MSKVAPSYNPAGWIMQMGLVILAVGAALMIVYSPNPVVGAIVFALVLGVEVPVAIWNFLGVRWTS